MPILLNDLFTGPNGTLMSAHVSDDGHAYINDAAAGNPVDLELNGAGQLVNYNLNFAGGAPSPAIVLPAAFSIVYNVILGNMGSVVSGGYFTHIICPQVPQAPQFQMDAATLYLLVGTNLPGNNFNMPRPANGAHVFQFDATANSRVWSVDGVAKLTLNGTPSLAGTTFKFQQYVGTANDYGASLLDQWQITTPAAPAPLPPGFGGPFTGPGTSGAQGNDPQTSKVFNLANYRRGVPIKGH